MLGQARVARERPAPESMMSAVSIVIPTRNRAHLLERTLHAASAQMGVDLEIVVVDDGSTDSTPRVIARAADKRIRYIRNDAATGMCASRNRGIGAAQGDWIAFLDDDDLWAPEKLVRQIAAAKDAGASWAYAGDVNVDARLSILSGGPPPDPDSVIALLPRWNPLASGASNVIVRADTLATVGGFDPALRRTGDWDLWIRMARTGRPACVREPLVAYRFHSDNIAADPGDMVDEARRLAARYGIPVDLAAMHRRAAWNALRAGRRTVALRHYASAILRGDLRSLGRAAVALMHPSVGTDGLFKLLGRDAAWVAQADRWLEAFKRPTTPGHGSDA